MQLSDVKFNIINVFFIFLTVVLYPVSRRFTPVDTPCRVTAFEVDPRFVCHSECTMESAPEGSPLCDVLSREIERKSAYLCYKKRYGLDALSSKDFYDNFPEEYALPEDTFDPEQTYYVDDYLESWVCPKDGQVCDGGRRMMEPHAKCGMYCPLAFNVTVEYHLHHQDTNIRMKKDLSTDDKRFNDYRQKYSVGNELICGVYDNGRKVYFYDDVVGTKNRWLPWTLFSMAVLGTIVTTGLSVRECVLLRRGHERRQFPPLIPGTGTPS